MNGIQNFSKRIRKRIQNSVKRLFTNKSTGPDEHSQLSPEFNKAPEVEFQNQRSYRSLQSTSSGDEYKDLRNKMCHEEISPEPVKSNQYVMYPSKSGENVIASPDISEKSPEIIEKGTDSNVTKRTKEKTSGGKYKPSLICPTGRHADLNQDESCVCIHMEQLSYHQTQPIIYEWHKFKSEPTSLDSLKLEHPTTSIQGGQGVVFWVYDSKNNRNFALKMKLRDTRSKSSWLIEQRESKMLKKIEHNFIVNLFHVHESAEAMFMTMEYLDGGCLWSHIAKKGTLPESYTIYYTACIVDALRYLHQINIVYRDLKAENIVLDALGRPKLIDFGMAKRIGRIFRYPNAIEFDEETENYPATQYYFAAYLAPEIYSRPSSANTFIDSWGIGYVVSELLLGYGVFVPMPWENTDDNKIKENWTFMFDNDPPISQYCKEFLERMLVYNPTSRMSIEESLDHPFFRQVRWSTLVYIKPPNLSIFRNRIKGSKIIRALLNSESQLPSFFEICDLQLPDPILTPMSMNQRNATIYEIATPMDTPVNPNAPSIKLPVLIGKDNKNTQKYKNMSNNFKYDVYRALRVKPSETKKTPIDTISNLRPIRKF